VTKKSLKAKKNIERVHKNKLISKTTGRDAPGGHDHGEYGREIYFGTERHKKESNTRKAIERGKR